MEMKHLILIGIVILVIALAGVTAFIVTSDSSSNNNTTKNQTVIPADANITVVGDNSTLNLTNTTNQTYKVYNPQTDSYVEVIGEAYDADVGRWYTYDVDGVRYYNTRINH